jgi:MinD-like ATPase involved in chromosome partitioning or flagellar assembly
MENGPSLIDWYSIFHGQLTHMDQANTLRHLLGQRHALIHPIMGDMASDYAACLGRLVLEQQARQSRVAVLFDGSSAGLPQLLPATARHDLIDFFNGKHNLEDQVVQLGEGQYLVVAKQGLQALAQKPAQAAALLGKLHRMPVSCDRFYATLPYEAVALARAFSPQDEWYWVVQPTARSVTRAFQAIRSSKGVDENIQHRVIVAGVKNTDEADHVFANLLESTSQFLVNPLQYAGHLPALLPGKALNQVGREMIAAGRRIAKAICSFDEHALA